MKYNTVSSVKTTSVCVYVYHRVKQNYIDPLASCLINATVSSGTPPSRRRQLLYWLAAQGYNLTDDWSLPSAHFVDS